MREISPTRSGGSSVSRTSVSLPSRGVSFASGLAPPPHLVGERARAVDVLGSGGLVCVSALGYAQGFPPPELRRARSSVAIGGDPGIDGLGRDACVRRLRAGRDGSRNAVSSRSAAGSSTSSARRAVTRFASSSSAMRSSPSARSRRLRSVRYTRWRTRSSTRPRSGRSVSVKAKLEHEARRTAAARRSRATDSTARPCLGARPRCAPCGRRSSEVRSSSGPPPSSIRSRPASSSRSRRSVPLSRREGSLRPRTTSPGSCARATA